MVFRNRGAVLPSRSRARPLVRYSTACRPPNCDGHFDSAGYLLEHVRLWTGDVAVVAARARPIFPDWFAIGGNLPFRRPQEWRGTALGSVFRNGLVRLADFTGERRTFRRVGVSLADPVDVCRRFSRRRGPLGFHKSLDNHGRGYVLFHLSPTQLCNCRNGITHGTYLSRRTFCHQADYPISAHYTG